jgi:photosystem II stability/assembly factor-like uncharacterized protein
MLVAVPFNTVPYTSTNGGGTWITNNSAFGNDWHYVASSADGMRLIAAGNVGKLVLSTNGGSSWATSNVPVAAWSAVASSADGSKLAAAISNGRIYTSADSGSTWVTNSVPNLNWMSIASSADGTRLAAVWGGATIFISTDSGSSWSSNNAGGDFISIACSADGTRLVAASTIGPTGKICTSTDAGATWISNSIPNSIWRSVASSADGNRLVAAANGGGIYTRYTTPSPQLSLTPAAGNLLLSWTVPSTNFAVQQKSNVSAGNWTTLSALPTLNLTNLQEELILIQTNARGFFRLSTP